MRKLATVQRIEKVELIEGADRIEKVTVLGWECVAKKKEFVTGDLCIYFEIDSVLPDHPVFEFMRERKFRVRTIKLRGQIAQGLAMPLEIMREFSNCVYEPSAFYPGYDVTEEIGVTKYDPEKAREKKLIKKEAKSKFAKFMTKYQPLRSIYFYFRTPVTERFPTDIISKTDETRIQNVPNFFKSYKDHYFYIMEKLDGQSATYIKTKKDLKVCSRNIQLNKRDDSNYWDIAIQEDIKKRLPKGYVIQGEIVGPGIQGNKYDLEYKKFYVFNVYDLKKCEYLHLYKKVAFCNCHGFKLVPILYTHPFTDVSVQDIVERSKGKSALNHNTLREGLVIRSMNDETISVKAINPEFLLKYNL